MSELYLVAALLGLIAAGVHCTYARRRYLQPILVAKLSTQTKSMIQFVFHSLFVFMILSSLVLLACGFDAVNSMQIYGLVLFVSMNYGVLAIWQFYLWRISANESFEWGQLYWVLYALVAALSLTALLV